MNQQKFLIRISELLSRFKIQTTILNKNAQFDINIVAEDILIPILNIVFECNLTNAKYSENDSRFPAIDLLDKSKKIAFQITSTSSTTKVKETIEKIVKNKFYCDFDEFYIYIITQKKESGSYNKDIIKKATEDIFSFTESNIWDEADLYKKIASLHIDKISEIMKILEKQFSDVIKDETDIQHELRRIINESQNQYSEKYFVSELNGLYEQRQMWLEKKIFFEKKIPFISDINQEYSTYNQIKEVNQKIEYCNDKISEIISQKTAN